MAQSFDTCCTRAQADPASIPDTPKQEAADSARPSASAVNSNERSLLRVEKMSDEAFDGAPRTESSPPSGATEIDDMHPVGHVNVGDRISHLRRTAHRLCGRARLEGRHPERLRQPASPAGQASTLGQPGAEPGVCRGSASPRAAPLPGAESERHQGSGLPHRSCSDAGANAGLVVPGRPGSPSVELWSWLPVGSWSAGRVVPVDELLR